MNRVRRGSGDPVAHGTGFVDAFLQYLSVFAFLVKHELVMIFGNIVLAFLVPDAHGTEHTFHTEGT